MTWTKFYAEDLQTLRTTAQNFVARATWRLGLCTPAIECRTEMTKRLLQRPRNRNCGQMAVDTPKKILLVHNWIVNFTLMQCRVLYCCKLIPRFRATVKNSKPRKPDCSLGRSSPLFFVTKWLSPLGKVLLESPVVPQIEEFAAFYGTWSFITIFKTAHQLSRAMTCHPISLGLRIIKVKILQRN